MSRQQIQTPSFGGEKARRLFWATIKGGCIKISENGKFIWVFESRSPLISTDGHLFDAKDFVDRAAATLNIQKTDVFNLEDDRIRDIARQLSGINPESLDDASEASDAENN
jgi:hypothetical protein